MRCRLNGALLAITVAAIAPPLHSQCALVSVSVENPSGSESLAARTPVTIAGNPCLHYVELDADVDTVQLVFRGTAAAVTNVDAPDQIATWGETLIPNGVALTIALRSPATHTLRFSAQVGANASTVDLYVARKPEIEIERSSVQCFVGQICLATEATSQVIFGGSNLDEIDLAAGVAIGAQSFTLARDGEHLLTQIPPNTVPALAQNVTFRTRRPYLDAAGTATSAIVLQGVRVSQSTAKNELILAAEGGTGESTVFVGQNVVLDIHVPGGLTLVPNTYTIEEAVGQQQRTVVGMLDVLTSAAGTATVRILGVAPTVNDLKGHGSFVYVTKRDTVKFHSRLSVQHRPVIENWTIHHVDSRHRDQSVHPGETVLLTLTGKNLLAFGDVAVAGLECRNPCRFAHPSQNELRIQFPFAGPPIDRLPVTLKSDIARDTTIALPTAPSLQPRPLDFVRVVFDSVQFRPRLVPAFPFIQLRDRDTAGYTLESAEMPGNDFGTNTLHGVRLVVEPHKINSGALHGTQHLVVSAALLGPEGEKVEEDSVRLSIPPADSALASRLGFENVAAYTAPRVVQIDDMIDRLGRFSQPGSSLEITVRHDSIRYGGEPGFRRHIRIRNDTRFRVRPHAEVLAGAFYIARTRGPRVKTLAPTGAPADSISRRGEPRTGFDALSMLGSIGIDAAVLNEEGRPTFARMRLGLLAMQSPFDQDSPRQFGISMLYPIELVSTRGGLALSISGGGVCLFNERCFALISPGFSMTLGR